MKPLKQVPLSFLIPELVINLAEIRHDNTYAALIIAWMIATRVASELPHVDRQSALQGVTLATSSRLTPKEVDCAILTNAGEGLRRQCRRLQKAPLEWRRLGGAWMRTSPER